MAILTASGVSICFMVRDYKDDSLGQSLLRRLKGSYRKAPFWANRDISFSLERGDLLGIIGGNGAGKSTLLKAVAGIMPPTQGEIRRQGSLAALLELGSGFDPEMTVRENIYLRGAFLGYTHRFIQEKYWEILAFSELEDFENWPFSQLSSGMRSRLAFAIASLVQPDILVLDEVLAVGDGAFRAKSERKMREIIEGGAATILVTHAIHQVRSLCNKVLWLHKGRQVIFTGAVETVCDRYEDFLRSGGPLPDLSGIERLDQGGL